MMVRVTLVIDSEDFGKQSKWRVVELPRYVLAPRLQGKADVSYGSFWYVWLGGDVNSPDGNYCAVSKRERAKVFEEVLITEWFQKKLPATYKVLEYIKDEGEKLGVRTVMVVSGSKKSDYRRKFVKELFVKMIKGQRCKLAKYLYGSSSRLKSMVFMDLSKDGVKYGALLEYGRPVAYVVEDYVFGDEEKLKEYLSEVIL